MYIAYVAICKTQRLCSERVSFFFFGQGGLKSSKICCETVTPTLLAVFSQACTTSLRHLRLTIGNPVTLSLSSVVRKGHRVFR
jgi:hypothetical protein